MKRNVKSHFMRSSFFYLANVDAKLNKNNSSTSKLKTSTIKFKKSTLKIEINL